MTYSAAPVTTAPSGLKAKVADLGLKAYLKAPPPVQNAMLQGYTKAQPVVARVSPHRNKVLGGGLALLVVRRLRRHRK